MTAPAFTPAPLEIRVSQAPTASGQFHLYLADKNGRKIAALWGGSDEKLANGYLYSAAPELYRKLESAPVLPTTFDQYEEVRQLLSRMASRARRTPRQSQR